MGGIGLEWGQGKNQEFGAGQKLWCLLGIQVGKSWKQLDVYDSELQGRCPDWKYKLKISQSIGNIQKDRQDGITKDIIVEGEEVQRLRACQGLDVWEMRRNDQMKHSHDEDSTMEMHHPNSPFKEGLASQFKEVWAADSHSHQLL